MTCIICNDLSKLHVRVQRSGSPCLSSGHKMHHNWQKDGHTIYVHGGIGGNDVLKICHVLRYYLRCYKFCLFVFISLMGIIIGWMKKGWCQHLWFSFFEVTFQCFDVIGWVTGTASGAQQPVSFILKETLLEQVQEEKWGWGGNRQEKGFKQKCWCWYCFVISSGLATARSCMMA